MGGKNFHEREGRGGRDDRQGYERQKRAVLFENMMVEKKAMSAKRLRSPENLSQILVYYYLRVPSASEIDF